MISSISQLVFEKNWKTRGHIRIDQKEYKIATFTEEDKIFYILGRLINFEDPSETNPRLAVVFKIELHSIADLGFNLGYKNLYNVFGVAVEKSMQGLGIAKTMYKFIVNVTHINILGDKNQYFGARRLWAKMSKDLDVVVDIVDVKKKIVLDQGVELYHGRHDHDFDQRVWSYSRDKENIRLVMRSIAKN